MFKKIKEIKDVLIIFLIANDLELAVVKGLDMGADDYITKPFKARELISRIRNVLRRIGKEWTNIIKIKNIVIDTNWTCVKLMTLDYFPTFYLNIFNYFHSFY